VSTGAAALPRRPEAPENIQVRAGVGFAMPPWAVAALGWLTLCLTIGYHFGAWLAPLGVGLGLLLAGLGLMARDALASWWLAYLEGREKAQEGRRP
jgi:hypothetical protein